MKLLINDYKNKRLIIIIIIIIDMIKVLSIQTYNPINNLKETHIFL